MAVAISFQCRGTKSTPLVSAIPAQCPLVSHRRNSPSKPEAPERNGVVPSREKKTWFRLCGSFHLLQLWGALVGGHSGP